MSSKPLLHIRDDLVGGSRVLAAGAFYDDRCEVRLAIGAEFVVIGRDGREVAGDERPLRYRRVDLPSAFELRKAEPVDITRKRAPGLIDLQRLVLPVRTPGGFPGRARKRLRGIDPCRQRSLIRLRVLPFLCRSDHFALRCAWPPRPFSGPRCPRGIMPQPKVLPGAR